MSFKEFIIKAMSENGEPSSKRVLGSVVILVYVIIVSVMSLRYGITDPIKSLLETGFIGGCSLLGISAVTNIFKSDNDNGETNS